MVRMTTIKVDPGTRDAVRAIAQRQGVTMDVAIRRMTELARREMMFADLKRSVQDNPPGADYLNELSSWESEAWS